MHIDFTEKSKWHKKFEISTLCFLKTSPLKYSFIYDFSLHAAYFPKELSKVMNHYYWISMRLIVIFWAPSSFNKYVKSAAPPLHTWCRRSIWALLCSIHLKVWIKPTKLNYLMYVGLDSVARNISIGILDTCTYKPNFPILNYM